MTAGVGGGEMSVAFKKKNSVPIQSIELSFTDVHSVILSLMGK